MSKNLLFTFMFSLVFSTLTIAQDILVKGRVIDNTGEGVPGATVQEKGTTNGIAADYDGNYSIKVSSKQSVLIFASIGYATQEVAIGNQSVINVTLGDDVTELEAVIVTGYGEAKKSTFTGTVTQVGGEQLQVKNVSNVADALTGEAAGVQIINSSGSPGTAPTIRIRGYGSVNGNRNPLYVVDGLPFNGSISSINPSDIESVSILKDASATAIYGSRGANGVVVITTKSGSKKETTIEVEAKYGVNARWLPDYDVITSPEEYVELSWEGLKNQGVITGASDPVAYANTHLFGEGLEKSKGLPSAYNMWDKSGSELIDPATGKFREGINRKYTPEQWEDEIFDAASRKEVNIKLSGGSDKSQYFTSFGFLDDDGYYVGSDYKRYTGRVNVNHQIREWLSGGMNLGYSHSERNSPGQGDNSGNGFWFVNNIPSIYPVFMRDENGNKIPDERLGGFVYDFGKTYSRKFALDANPAGVSQIDINKRTYNEVSGISHLKAEITDYLNVLTRFSAQFQNVGRTSYSNPFIGGSTGTNGALSKYQYNTFSYTWLQQLNFSKSYGLHNLSAFVAHENTSFEFNYLYGAKETLADPFGTELDNAVNNPGTSSYFENYKLESFFGQVKYDFDDKYFVHVTLRRDGSSRFVGDNKWGNFGSVGLGWVATKEDFLSGIDWLDFLKVKASYGRIGEQGGGGSALDLDGYYPGLDQYEVSNQDGGVALNFKWKGNPDLTWETSNIFQVGTEFTLFDRVEGSLDYYVKNTTDLFFDRRVPISLGYAFIKVNDGELRNRGLEFNFNVKAIETQDFKFNIGLNGAFEGNEMTKMPIDPATGKGKVINENGIYDQAKGYSLFDIRVPEYAGVNTTTGEPMWATYTYVVEGEKIYIRSYETEIINVPEGVEVKKELTNDYQKATEKFTGKSRIPVVSGAFRLNAEYKGFQLTAQFLYSLGGYSYDGNYATLANSGVVVGNNNWHTDIRDRWQQPGDVTDVPRLSNGEDANISRASTRYITKNDYLSLNNIRLGYTLPKSLTEKLQVKNVQVWISGDNLWLFSKRDGFNPSTSENGASDEYRYTPVSTITGGVKVNF